MLRHLAPAVLLAMPLAAQADELPPRAPGLWEQTSYGADGKPRIERTCVGAGDRSAFLTVLGKQDCAHVVKRLGDAWSIETDCRIKGLAVMGRMRVVGDFETFARAELVTTVTDAKGELAAPRAATTIDARRTGDCPKTAR